MDVDVVNSDRIISSQSRLNPRTEPAVDARKRAGLPRRHERVHDGARGPPAAGLTPPLLDPPAHVRDRRLQPLRLGRGRGLLLLR